ncbi:MAG: transposase [Desulfobacterales bacterium]|nr:transposase [Desulfobacterales bacterium]
MPRQPRLDAPGVLQHVMARGIERRKIFWDDKDRSSFLKRLAMLLEETQTQCYAWALIPNHFHLLLRTGLSASADASRCRAGPTPLSTVMRRLMTGYAVTFNIRHRRSGHLFQNRYKSVVCEEDPYLLELIRYIHLNPLRAKLVEDLKSLDKYPWSGHSAILGRRKNPLIPEPSKRHNKKIFTPLNPTNVGHLTGAEIPPAIEEDKYLAGKTVEDVLQYFGKNLKKARRRYRQFVEKGIKHGRRTDLQGGGLIRSSGGDKAGLLGLKKEEREKGDARILGSGHFVERVLSNSHRIECPKIVRKILLPELVGRISTFLKTEKDEVLFGNRKQINCHARNLICFIAVKSMGYKFNEIADTLKMHPVTAGRCAEKGRKLLDSYEGMWEVLK